MSKFDPVVRGVEIIGWSPLDVRGCVKNPLGNTKTPRYSLEVLGSNSWDRSIRVPD